MAAAAVIVERFETDARGGAETGLDTGPELSPGAALTGDSALDCSAIWEAYDKARDLCERSSGAVLEEAQRAESEALWALVNCPAADASEILLKLNALKHTLGLVNGWKDGREKALLDSAMLDVAAILSKHR